MSRPGCGYTRWAQGVLLAALLADVAPRAEALFGDDPDFQALVEERNGSSAALVLTLAGSGAVGNADGSGKDASFWQPTDVALLPNQRAVMVADSRNHQVPNALSPALDARDKLTMHGERTLASAACKLACSPKRCATDSRCMSQDPLRASSRHTNRRWRPVVVHVAVASRCANSVDARRQWYQRLPGNHANMNTRKCALRVRPRPGCYHVV